MDEVGPRVGDRERAAVDARLQQAVGDGVLTLQEYEERSGAVWQARTRPDLDAATCDLPAPAPVTPPAPTGRRPRPRRVLAVMSGDESTGPLAPGQGVEAYALMGGAKLDLRRDDLPAHVRVRAVAVMGGVEVLVPRGVAVHLTGMSLMGGRTLHDLVQPRPGAPVVHVDGWALMGGVDVGHGPDREVPSSPSAASLPASGPPPVPTPAASVQLPFAASRERRRGPLRLGVGGLALAAALGLGGVAVATQDAGSVFGSSVYRVPAGQTDVDVSSVFGSTTLVVDDDRAVSSGGVVVFGSADCDACGAEGTQPPVEVDAYGAFGSVEVLTATQYAQREADDAREESDDSDQDRD